MSRTWLSGNRNICFSSSFLCMSYLPNSDLRIFKTVPTNFISCLDCFHFSKLYPVHGTKKIFLVIVSESGSSSCRLIDISPRLSLGLYVLNLESSSFWLFSSRLCRSTFANFVRVMEEGNCSPGFILVL